MLREEEFREIRYCQPAVAAVTTDRRQSEMDGGGDGGGDGGYGDGRADCDNGGGGGGGDGGSGGGGSWLGCHDGYGQLL